VSTYVPVAGVFSSPWTALIFIVHPTGRRVGSRRGRASHRHVWKLQGDASSGARVEGDRWNLLATSPTRMHAVTTYPEPGTARAAAVLAERAFLTQLR
jgi:hypothetical protein